MTIKMNTSIQMERYQWILPIIEKRLTYAETLKVCPHSKRSLERWIAAYRAQGLHIHERTIGKIIKREGLVRKYRMKKVKYKYL